MRSESAAGTESSGHAPPDTLAAPGPRRTTAEAKLSFLAAASRCLAGSLDYEATLRTVAGLALPFLGSWCILDLVESDESMRRIAILHPDPRKQELADQLTKSWAPRAGDLLGAAHAVRTCRTEVIPHVDDDMLVSVARDPEHLRTLRALGIGSVLVVPLVARGHVLGGLTMVSADSGHQYTEADIELAEDLGARCAMAIDNARLHRDARSAAECATRMNERLVIASIREQGLADEARSLAEVAREASLAKSRFLSSMSHELRTPLNAILGFGQLLEAEVDSEQERESVALILDAGRHLLGLIEELLDLARIEAGELNVAVQSVRVGDAVDQSLDLVRHMAIQRGISIASVSPSAAERRVLGDLQRLKQVILNLVSNAIKYNRTGGSVVVSCEEAEDARLRIVVSDTGWGISAEKLQRLFVPFERLEADRSAVEGTGLGLALSRKLMEAMGGALNVESREGVGSRFWAELPLASDGQADPAGPGPAAECESESERTVVMIEADPAKARLMERIFRRRPKVRLLGAVERSMGLELARAHQPGLILLGLDLPGTPGLEVLRELRIDPALRDVPVVVVGGNVLARDAERLKAAGAHGHITEPFDVKELLRLLDETLYASPAARRP